MLLFIRFEFFPKNSFLKWYINRHDSIMNLLAFFDQYFFYYWQSVENNKFTQNETHNFSRSCLCSWRFWRGEKLNRFKKTILIKNNKPRPTQKFLKLKCTTELVKFLRPFVECLHIGFADWDNENEWRIKRYCISFFDSFVKGPEIQ